MGFFATFWSWLNSRLTVYIGENTALLAAVLEPAIVTFATLYVMAWGYMHLTGKIEEPFTTGLKRIIVLALILGVSLKLWLYNTVIVDTFYHAPARLAAAVVGAADPVKTIDTIWERGGSVAGVMWGKAAHFYDFGYYFAGAVVWLFMGILCVYAMFLIALSSIALAVLLALGPFFIAMLLFEVTQRFFTAWISQLANYALITILTIMVCALLLSIVESYAVQTAALGTGINTVDTLNMMLVAVLVFLVFRQVMPIASSLAGGISLHSLGLVSRSSRMAARAGMAIGGRGAAYAAPAVARVMGRFVRGRWLDSRSE